MRPLQLGKVYPITDSRNRNALSHVELAAQFLEGGVRFFQVREKTLPDRALYEQLLQIKDLCRSYGAQFVVNDRLDLALAAGADGLHLGQTDLPVAVVRKWFGPTGVIGISTHTLQQFQEAQSLDVDYVAIGPVFVTSTKESEYSPLGAEVIQKLASRAQHPVVAIGGINLEAAPILWEAGVASVAVISDLVNAGDPAARVRQYLKAAKALQTPKA